MTIAPCLQAALPLEILLGILETFFATDSWESVLCKPHQFLLVNRVLRDQLLPRFYRTVFLKTPAQTTLFLNTVRSFPYLGKLVFNIWVSVSTGNVSAHEAGLSLDLLSVYTPNLLRLSLPKLSSSKSVIKLEHSPLLPHLHTLCIHSMPKRAFFLDGILEHLKSLHRIFIAIPAESEEGDLEISSGLWAMALIAVIGDRPTRIKELVLKVPAHPNNNACVGQLKTKNMTVVISMTDTSFDEEKRTYSNWLEGRKGAE